MYNLVRYYLPHLHTQCQSHYYKYKYYYTILIQLLDQAFTLSTLLSYSRMDGNFDDCVDLDVGRLDVDILIDTLGVTEVVIWIDDSSSSVSTKSTKSSLL